MAVPIIPLLSIGASILGNLFGKTSDTNQNENTNTREAINALVNSTSSQVGDQSTKTRGITTNSGRTNTTGRESSTGVQNTDQYSVGTESGSIVDVGYSRGGSTESSSGFSSQQGVGTSSVSRLDDATKASLTSLVQSLMGNQAGGGAALASEINRVQSQPAGFDTDSYVRGIMERATGNLRDRTDSAMGEIKTRTGGTRGTNSAAALLANKLDRQNAEALAGVEAEATATGAELNRTASGQRTADITALTGAQGNQMTQLLQSLIGASETGRTTDAVTGSQSEFASGTQYVDQGNSQVRNLTTTDHTKGVSTTRDSTVSKVTENTFNKQIADLLEAVKSNVTTKENTNQVQSGVTQSNTSTNQNTTDRDWTNLADMFKSALGATF